MNNTADVIIIGGGIHGASLAFHLAQRGVSALVLEQRFIAAEATGRSSGLVRMHYDLALESQLAWLSFQYFRDWQARVGGECGFTRTGFLKIVPRHYEEQLRANVLMQQEIGISSQIVTAAEVQEIAPYIQCADFNVAAFEPDSGYADPSATTMSLINAARDKGARLVQDCRVTGIDTADGKVRGVSTTQGNFAAPAVVNAAGAWAAEVGRLAGLELPVRVWKHDTIFVRHPRSLDDHLTIIDDTNAMYFRPETGGLTLIGLEDGNPIGESPADFSDHVAPGFADKAVDRLCLRIPLMEQGSFHSAHGGIDGITPDQRAIMGQAGPDGFYLVCGFSGTGFKIGPAVGLCMAELITDGQAKTVDITPFALARFAEGKELVGEHAYDDIWR
ncbi:MAG: FAD-binding oxidoreductase [Candidatus Promineifilaceae bacterium]|nr:FAD-binding oxidoreductase [Candidatus Promineifilaceae bacterium]